MGLLLRTRSAQRLPLIAGSLLLRGWGRVHGESAQAEVGGGRVLVVPTLSRRRQCSATVLDRGNSLGHAIELHDRPDHLAPDIRFLRSSVSVRPTALDRRSRRPRRPRTGCGRAEGAGDGPRDACREDAVSRRGGLRWRSGEPPRWLALAAHSSGFGFTRPAPQARLV